MAEVIKSSQPSEMKGAPKEDIYYKNIRNAAFEALDVWGATCKDISLELIRKADDAFLNGRIDELLLGVIYGKICGFSMSLGTKLACFNILILKPPSPTKEHSDVVQDFKVVTDSLKSVSEKLIGLGKSLDEGSKSEIEDEVKTLVKELEKVNEKLGDVEDTLRKDIKKILKGGK